MGNNLDSFFAKNVVRRLAKGYAKMGNILYGLYHGRSLRDPRKTIKRGDDDGGKKVPENRFEDSNIINVLDNEIF